MNVDIFMQEAYFKGRAFNIQPNACNDRGNDPIHSNTQLKLLFIWISHTNDFSVLHSISRL